MIETRSKNKSNILITGGEGFIGTHLVNYIKDNFKNCSYKTYDIKTGLDILDKEKLISKLRGVEIVVHLAAEVSVPNSWENPKKFYETNIIGTQNVIEAALEAGVKRVVFASSSAVYDDSSSPYALTKSVNEKMLQMYSDKIQVVVTRFFNVYGPGQNREYAAVIPAFYDKIVKGEPINIYGDGKQTRDFTYVSDVVRAVYLAATSPLSDPFTILEVGRGESTAIKDLANIMGGLLNKEVQINFLPARKEVKHSVSNPKEAREKINFRAVYNIESGLKELLEKVSNF